MSERIGGHLEGNGDRTTASAGLSEFLNKFSDVSCVAAAVVPAFEPQGLETFHRYNQTGDSAHPPGQLLHVVVVTAGTPLEATQSWVVSTSQTGCQTGRKLIRISVCLVGPGAWTRHE